MMSRHVARTLVHSLQRAKRLLFPRLDLARFPVARRWADRLEAAARRQSVVRVLGHTLYLDDRDSLGLSQGSLFEPAETHFFERLVRPGQTVLDVGANIGYFTLQFARAVGPAGRVVAVEPEPANAALLRRNVDANGYENVSIVERAAWHERATLEMHLSARNRGDHRLFAAEERRRTVRIEAAPLDALADVPARVDVVKVDIQGAELHAIRGMTGLLERNRDVVLVVELWPLGLRRAGTTPEMLVDALRALGFTLHVLRDDASVERADLARLLGSAALEGEGYANLVCARGALP